MAAPVRLMPVAPFGDFTVYDGGALLAAGAAVLVEGDYLLTVIPHTGTTCTVTLFPVGKTANDGVTVTLGPAPLLGAIQDLYIASGCVVELQCAAGRVCVIRRVPPITTER